MKWNEEHDEILICDSWKTVRCKDCLRLAWKGEKACCHYEGKGITSYPNIHNNDIEKWRSCARFDLIDKAEVDRILDIHREEVHKNLSLQ